MEHKYGVVGMFHIIDDSLFVMQSYFTVELSGGISESTEFPFGKDRSCMRPYFPGTDFGD
jgi:hypothetical protein